MNPHSRKFYNMLLQSIYRLCIGPFDPDNSSLFWRSRQSLQTIWKVFMISYACFSNNCLCNFSNGSHSAQFMRIVSALSVSFMYVGNPAPPAPTAPFSYCKTSELTSFHGVTPIPHHRLQYLTIAASTVVLVSTPQPILLLRFPVRPPIHILLIPAPIISMATI